MSASYLLAIMLVIVNDKLAIYFPVDRGFHLLTPETETERQRHISCCSDILQKCEIHC